MDENNNTYTKEEIDQKFYNQKEIDEFVNDLKKYIKEIIIELQQIKPEIKKLEDEINILLSKKINN